MFLGFSSFELEDALGGERSLSASFGGSNAFLVDVTRAGNDFCPSGLEPGAVETVSGLSIPGT